MITQIIIGAVGGLALSLTGLAKKESRESFDWKKMLPTVIIAGIIGGIAGWQNVDYGIIENSAVAIAITSVVENSWKALWRKVINK